MTKEIPAQEESRETTPEPSLTSDETIGVSAPSNASASEEKASFAQTSSASGDGEKDFPMMAKEHPSSAQTVPQNEADVASASSFPKPVVEHTGFAARCFDACSLFGPVILGLLWILQSLPTLMDRPLQTLFGLASKVQGELAIKNGEIIQQMPDVSSSLFHPIWNWIQTWLQRFPESVTTLLNRIPGFPPDSTLHPISLVTACSTLCLLLLTWGFAKAIGKEKQAAFAAGLILLSSLTWMGLPVSAGKELLLACVLTLSLLCLYRGWVKTFAPLWLITGFALIAPAAVEGGLLGLLLPLVCSVLFLLWRGNFRRAGAYDGALAFGIMLILLCLWGTYIAFGEGRDALYTLLNIRFRIPLMESMHMLDQNRWTFFPALALLWLPWTLVVFFVPWQRLGAFFTGFIKNRKEHPGQGWLWCWILAGFALLYGFESNTPERLIPLLPPLAILTAQGILSLSPRSSNAFMAFLSFLLFLIGLLFAVLSLWPTVLGELPPVLAGIPILPLSLGGMLVQTGIPFLFAFLLWKGTNRFSPKGSLLVFCLLTLLLALPRAWYVSAAETSTPIQSVPAARVASPPSFPVHSASEKTVSPSSSENSILDVENGAEIPKEASDSSIQENSLSHEEVPNVPGQKHLPLSLPQLNEPDVSPRLSEENVSNQPVAEPILSEPLPQATAQPEPNE